MKPIVAIAYGATALLVAYTLNGNQSYFQSTSALKCPVLKDVETVKNQLSNPW
jgi:hypothetical protein